MMEGLNSEEVSLFIFGNAHMAAVAAWVRSKDLDEQFAITEAAHELGAAPDLLAPVFHRLGRIGLVARHTKTEWQGPVPYTRDNNPLWEPLGALCRQVLEIGNSE
jgi:hypothetical protein